MLPRVDDPELWQSPSILAAVARHLIASTTFDVPASDLQDDVVAALQSSAEVRVRWSDRASEQCELHGTYDFDSQTITLRRGQNLARTNFTAAHELGHHLQATDPDWALKVLAPLRKSHPGLMRRVEESLANTVAAMILMPDDLVASKWAGRLSPQFVNELSQEGRVSRQAAVMRAAGLSDSEPAILIVSDRHGSVVTSNSTTDELFRVPKGSVQPDLRTLFEQAPFSGSIASAGLVYSTGNARADFSYEGDLDHSGDYLIVVARPIYRFGDQQWSNEDVECPFEACATVFLWNSENTCTDCHRPKCPQCGNCDGCEAPAAKTCVKCFMEMSLAESAAGDIHAECP